VRRPGAALFPLSDESVPSLHESSVQTLESSQSVGGPAVHVPPAHTSPSVQNWPSSHGAALFTWSHESVPSLHESSVQTFESSQSRGPSGLQLPAPSQVSNVQKSPSSSHSEPAVSYWQVDEQQSPSAVLSSSHCSPG